MTKRGRRTNKATSMPRALRPRLFVGLLALLAATIATPGVAREDVRIGVGYGIAFLPTYLCQELNLVEKQGRSAGLDVKASYQHYLSSAAMQDAILSGAIDMGPYGVAPLLMAWDRADGTPQQAIAVSGLTTLPLTLLTNRPGVHSIEDLRPADRIAMPSLASPQMYVLQMQSEKLFGSGRYDKLRPQVVAMPHADAINALLSGSSEITAYFSSPPFTQIALRSPKIHAVLDSADVVGEASFLIVGATRHYADARPKIAAIVAKALQEAADFIKSDPHRAAEIYLKYEPSKTLDVATVESVLKDLQDNFGDSVHGVQAYADFMKTLGQLKNAPKSWKQIVAPAIANTSSS
jgi:NitT/TauT family transport system substrate-binding protein